MPSEGSDKEQVVGRRERGPHMAVMGSPYDGEHLRIDRVCGYRGRGKESRG